MAVLSKDLRILLNAQLDFNSTQTSINNQIAALEKKVNKLKIKIDINDKAIKTMQKFSKAVEDYKRSYDKLNQTVQQSEKIIKNADGTIDRYTSRLKANGEVVKTHTQTIDNRNKALQNESKFIQQNIKALEQQDKIQKRISNNKTGKKNETYGDRYKSTSYEVDKNGRTNGNSKTTENFNKLTKDAERLKAKLNELNNAGAITDKVFQGISKGINSAKSEASINRISQSLQKLQNKAKESNRLDALGGKVSNFQSNFALDAEKLRRQFRGTVDKTALSSLIAQSKELKATTPNLQNEIRKLQTSLKQLKLDASSSSTALRELGHTSIDAFKKFSSWVGISTIFFGAINAAKQLTQTIIEVDGAMTDLRKVMSPTTNFDQVLVNATANAKELGKTITDVLASYNEFAKQGYNDKQMEQMADAALITSNVGEMEAGQAAQFLTSAIIQYKMETKDAITVVDAWNEVSNNNATTVGNLAQGWSKSASVAKQFGLDMNELNAAIGTVTASTKVSGNEAGNFLKNVMPRLLSKPGKNALDMVGVSLTNGAGEMRDAMDIYAEVAQKLQGADKMTKNIVAEGLAGKYHISKMSSLLSSMDLYNKMLKDSENSAGSARRENETYMESIEAKTNIMKANFQELSLSIGKAFVTEGMIQFIKGLTTVVGWLTKMTNAVGVLPPLLTTLAVATLLCKKNLLGMAVQMGLVTKASKLLRIESKLLQAALATTIVGAGVFALGMGIEFLVGKLGEARQKSEDLAAKNRDMVNSYKENKKEIGSLADEYGKLESKINSGSYTNEDLEKFQATRTQLAQLYPTLVQGEDSYGNVVLGTSKQIKAQIELAERQLAVQEKLNAAKAMDEAKDNYDTATKDNKKAQKKLDNAFAPKLHLLPGNPFAKDYEMEFNNLKKASDRYKELQEKVANGDKLNRSEKGDYKYLKNKMDEYTQLSNAAKQSSMTVQSAAMDVINNTVKMDDQTSKSVGSIISSFTLFASTSDQSAKTVERTFSGLMSNLQNDANVKPMFKEYASAIEEYNKQVANGLTGDELDAYKTKVKASYKEIKDYLVSIAKDNGFSDAAIKELKKNLDSSTIGTLNLSGAQDKANKSTGKTVDEVKNAAGAVDEFSDSMDGASTSAEDLEKELKDAQGDFQALAAIASQQAQAGNLDKAITIMQGQAYEALSDKVSIYNKVLEDNANGKRMSAAEAMNLIGKSGELSKVITIENGSVKINSKALLEMRDSAIKAYSDKMAATKQDAINQMKATLSNLNMFDAEIKAIKTVADARAQLAKVKENRQVALENGLFEQADDYRKQEEELSSVTEQLDAMDELTNMASKGLSEVGSSFEDTSKAADGYTGATEDAADATADVAEETEEYVFVLDKYKRELEKIELLLAKQTSITSKYPQHSKKYRESLQKEIEILKQKEAAIKAQNESLQTQIDDGYIQPTGVVNTGSTGLTGSGTGGSSYSGKFAPIINQAAAKYGVDPALIAGIIKQESQFNPNARSGVGATGLMQLMPATARSMGVKNAYDPTQNIMGGTKYIAQMLRKYNGNIETALRAYNAGPGNVANGKAYKFKETNDYVRKVTANYQGYKSGSMSYANAGSSVAMTAGASAGAKAASYYLNNFRISTPFSPGKGLNDGWHSGGHNGIDLAGKTSGAAMGKPIYSLTSGKVTQVFKNNPTAGNGVVVLGDDGRTYRYIHMKNTPPVKLGQKISADQQIGNIGSTGRSGGPHLDLKIVDKNGKYIDPQQVLKQMASGGGGSYSATNASQDAAQNLSNIADAESQIISNSTELIQIQDEIEQKRIEAEINSPLAEFDVKKGDVDEQIQASEARNERNLSYSDAYRKELQKQIDLNNQKYKIEKDEEKFLTDKMKSGKYSEAAVYEMKQRLDELKISQQETINASREVEKQMVDSSEEFFSRKRDALDAEISASQARNERNNDTSPSYRKELQKQLDLTNEKYKVEKEEEKFLQDAAKSGKFDATSIDIINQRLAELKTSYEETYNAARELEKALVDSGLNYYEEEKGKIDQEVQLQEIRIGRLSESSKEYSDALKEQASTIKKKQSLNEQEIKFLESALKNYKLSGTVIADYKNRLAELKLENEEIIQQYEEINAKIEAFRIDKMLKEMAKATKKVNDELAKIDHQLGLIEEDDYEAKIGLNTDKLEQQMNLVEQAKSNIDALKRELENTHDADNIERIKDELESWNDALVDAQYSVEDLQHSFVEMREEMADKAIDAMKEYYQKQQELENKALDKQIENINKVYEAKKRSLSDEISENQYKKEYDKLTKDRQDLQRQYNLTLTDNSLDAKAKRNDLKKQMDDLDQQIADLKENRSNDLRQQSLDDEQQKELDAKDKEREALDKKYSDILDNNKYWEDLKDSIVAGNFSETADTINKFIADASANFGELGTAIQSNLVEQLKEAASVMAVISGTDVSKVKATGAYAGDGGKFSEADFKYVAGKILQEKSGNVKNGQRFMDMAKTEGATVDKYDNMSLDEIMSTMSADEKMLLSKYITQSSTKDFTGDKKLQEYAKNLASSTKGSNISSSSKFSDALVSYGGKSQAGLGEKELKQEDFELLAGKYLSSVVAKQMKDSTSIDALKKVSETWKVTARNKGTTLDPDNAGYTFDELAKGMSDTQKSIMSKLIMEKIIPTLMGEAKDKTTSMVKSMQASIAKGGKDTSGNSTFDELMHQYRVSILNGSASSNTAKSSLASLLSTASQGSDLTASTIDSSTLSKIADSLKTFANTLPKASTPTSTLTDSISKVLQSITMNINIDKLTGDASGLKTFFETIQKNYTLRGGI